MPTLGCLARRRALGTKMPLRTLPGAIRYFEARRAAVRSGWARRCVGECIHPFLRVLAWGGQILYSAHTIRASRANRLAGAIDLTYRARRIMCVGNKGARSGAFGAEVRGRAARSFSPRRTKITGIALPLRLSCGLFG